MTGDVRLAPIGFHYFCRGRIVFAVVSGGKVRGKSMRCRRGVDYGLVHALNVDFFYEWLCNGIRSGDLDDIDCGAPR